MQPPQVDDLALRVGRLERENLRLKRAGLLTAGVLAVGLLVGQAAPKTQLIQTQRLVITDDMGNERIVMGANKDRASIMIKTDASKGSAVLAVAADTAGVSITDENGKHRLTLGKDLRQGGGAGLWLYDDQGTLRYTCGVDRKGPSVAVFDENGKRIP